MYPSPYILELLIVVVTLFIFALCTLSHTLPLSHWTSSSHMRFGRLTLCTRQDASPLTKVAVTFHYLFPLVLPSTHRAGIFSNGAARVQPAPVCKWRHGQVLGMFSRILGVLEVRSSTKELWRNLLIKINQYLTHIFIFKKNNLWRIGLKKTLILIFLKRTQFSLRRKFCGMLARPVDQYAHALFRRHALVERQCVSVPFWSTHENKKLTLEIYNGKSFHIWRRRNTAQNVDEQSTGHKKSHITPAHPSTAEVLDRLTMPNTRMSETAEKSWQIERDE